MCASNVSSGRFVQRGLLRVNASRRHGLLVCDFSIRSAILYACPHTEAADLGGLGRVVGPREAEAVPVACAVPRPKIGSGDPMLTFADGWWSSRPRRWGPLVDPGPSIRTAAASGSGVWAARRAAGRGPGTSIRDPRPGCRARPTDADCRDRRARSPSGRPARVRVVSTRRSCTRRSDARPGRQRSSRSSSAPQHHGDPVECTGSESTGHQRPGSPGHRSPPRGMWATLMTDQRQGSGRVDVGDTRS